MKNLTVLMSVLLSGACMASAGIYFYTDQALFESLYPGLTTEDYSNTNISPNSTGADPGPFNSFTDNACFSPDDIVEGISLDNLEGNENVVLTPPFMGVTSVTVGPNAFEDSAEYSFSVPVNVFGIEIVMPMGSGLVNIEVFGIGGSLGISSSNGTLAGVFWGVYSDYDITRIEFIEPATNGELFANAQFGAFSALDNSTWGSIKNSF
ncbi:MAG: hypothetical protein KAW14_08780 [Candidatus Aegiribacteria sp.]|nr:hypothetical protein [Candidatus Aegiribacteria sp.]